MQEFKFESIAAVVFEYRDESLIRAFLEVFAVSWPLVKERGFLGENQLQVQSYQLKS